jgi:hypothetical protein
MLAGGERETAMVPRFYQKKPALSHTAGTYSQKSHPNGLAKVENNKQSRSFPARGACR